MIAPAERRWLFLVLDPHRLRRSGLTGWSVTLLHFPWLIVAYDMTFLMVVPTNNNLSILPPVF